MRTRTARVGCMRAHAPQSPPSPPCHHNPRPAQMAPPPLAANLWQRGSSEACSTSYQRNIQTQASGATHSAACASPAGSSARATRSSMQAPCRPCRQRPSPAQPRWHLCGCSGVPAAWAALLLLALACMAAPAAADVAVLSTDVLGKLPVWAHNRSMDKVRGEEGCCSGKGCIQVVHSAAALQGGFLGKLCRGAPPPCPACALHRPQYRWHKI